MREVLPLTQYQLCCKITSQIETSTKCEAIEKDSWRMGIKQFVVSSVEDCSQNRWQRLLLASWQSVSQGGGGGGSIEPLKLPPKQDHLHSSDDSIHVNSEPTIKAV